MQSFKISGGDKSGGISTVFYEICKYCKKPSNLMQKYLSILVIHHIKKKKKNTKKTVHN